MERRAKAPKWLVRELLEIKDHLTMESAHFGELRGADMHLKESEVTDFIRERTLTWRRSWLLKPLDEILERLGAKEKP